MQQLLMGMFSWLFPNVVLNKAIKTLMNPQVLKLRDHEDAVLALSQKDTLKYKNFDIQLYRWGSGSQSILLVHGWEGQAGNFSEIVQGLLKEDFTIYAFDAPAHGHSTKGETSIFEFVEVVANLIKKFSVDHIISHSFGGVATTSALYDHPELQIDKYLLLTTPNRFVERIEDVAQMIGLSNRAKNKLLQRLQDELGDIESFNVSDFIAQVNVKEALIIHDKSDKVIPIERARAVHANWPASAMIEIEGTGHFRILRSPQVVQMTIDFFIK